MSGPSGHRKTEGAAGARLHPFHDPALRAVYEQLREASPQRTVFAHPAYVKAVAGAFGYTPRLATVTDAAGALVAAMPVFEKRRGPFQSVAVPPLTFFATPLLAAPLAEAGVHAGHSPLDALLDLLAAHYHQATLHLHPSLADARPLLWAGWHVRPRYTYALDLGDGGRSAWSQKARQTVSRESVHYRIEEGPAHGEAAVGFAEAAYRRRGLASGLDGAAARRLVARLSEHGLARCFAAFRGDEAGPEAAEVMLCDGSLAVDWVAGSRPGPARTVLLAAVFERLAASGVRHFDFGGANTPSIAEFKRRFGPRLVPYFHARRAMHPALRLLDRLRP